MPRVYKLNRMSACSRWTAFFSVGNICEIAGTTNFSRWADSSRRRAIPVLVGLSLPAGHVEFSDVDAWYTQLSTDVKNYESPMCFGWVLSLPRRSVESAIETEPVSPSVLVEWFAFIHVGFRHYRHAIDDDLAILSFTQQHCQLLLRREFGDAYEIVGLFAGKQCFRDGINFVGQFIQTQLDISTSFCLLLISFLGRRLRNENE